MCSQVTGKLVQAARQEAGGGWADPAEEGPAARYFSASDIKDAAPVGGSQQTIPKPRQTSRGWVKLLRGVSMEHLLFCVSSSP